MKQKRIKKRNTITRRIRNLLIRKRTLLIIISIFLLLTTTISITYGRYIYTEIRNYYLSSKNFYFNSDKLKDNMARYQIDNWSGVDSLNIIINLNSQKNNKLASDSDITYNISFTCSDNVTCTSSKTNGTILVPGNTDYFVMTITPNTVLQENDKVTMYLEASATSPYTKTISGFFTINIGIPGLSYEISDVSNRPYLLVNITNTIDYYKVITPFDNYQSQEKIDINTYLNLTDENKDKCASAIITLKFDPNIVILDMASSAYLKAFNIKTIHINSYDYVSEISFKMDALSSEVVNFYKKDTQIDYTYPFVNDTSIINVSYEI